MLVVDPKGRQVRAAPAEFGPPIASTRAGGLILYVYSYDIATKLQYEQGLTL